jgi:hypothetical protein
MASDPNCPKAGERAWGEKMRALNRKLDARAGAAMPVDDGTHAFEVSRYLATPAHELAMDLWQSVVGKVTTQLTGAANLMMFDDHERIMRDIEAAIASGK